MGASVSIAIGSPHSFPLQDQPRYFSPGLIFAFGKMWGNDRGLRCDAPGGGFGGFSGFSRFIAADCTLLPLCYRFEPNQPDADERE